ncbi:MAG: YgiT-type zinc finger protein [Polyangiaceae bacterium]|nr:YgiT-type zinc finger protein [Polyangiaceae bacterium]
MKASSSTRKARSGTSRAKRSSTSSSLPSARSSREVALRDCPACGKAGIAKRQVDKTYEAPGGRKTVKGIPAQVCPHCGEQFLGPAAAEYVDRCLGLSGKRRRPRAA